MRLLWLALAGAFFLVFGLAGAVVDPQVTRYRVAIKGLERPLRLVHLTDIHASPIDMPARRIARIVQAVNAERPDLVLITGDLLGGKIIDPPMRMEAAIRPLEALRAPLGVLAVMGNHDNEIWSPRVFARSRIRLLVGSWIDLGPLVVAGADSAGHLPPPIYALWHAIEDAPPGKPLITMSHEPETFQYLRGPTQLHLSGHSHGGQVMLPLIGGKRVNEFHDAHRRGLYRIGGRWLLVSAGLGTSILPLRINVPPEIVVVDLVPAYSTGRKSGTER
jgi:predicted MPP superfamily phosphohydrolase